MSSVVSCPKRCGRRPISSGGARCPAIALEPLLNRFGIALESRVDGRHSHWHSRPICDRFARLHFLRPIGSRGLAMSLVRFARRLHTDERGVVSLETVLIIGAIALPM